MSDMISRKDAIAAIVDVQSRTDAIVFGNSIHRPPVSVQEAAKVLLNDDEACLLLAEGHDREDAAQIGEPSPHVIDFGTQDYAEWAQDRVACIKAGLRDIAEGGEA